VGRAKNRKLTRNSVSAGRCHACGAFGALTKDHAPPKGVFPRSWHPRLPFFLACLQCNKQWETDSEYFRDMLLSGPLANCAHPALAQVRAAYERARIRRSLRGSNPDVLQTAGRSWVFNEVLLCPTVHHWIEWQRIAKVIWLSCNTAQILKRGNFIGNENKPKYTAHVMDIPAESPYYRRARDILTKPGDLGHDPPLYEASSLVAQNDPNIQEWLVSFYGEAIFMMKTMPTGIDRFESEFFPGARVVNGPGDGYRWRPINSTRY